MKVGLLGLAACAVGTRASAPRATVAAAVIRRMTGFMLHSSRCGVQVGCLNR